MNDNIDNPLKTGRYDFRISSCPPSTLVSAPAGNFWMQAAQSAFESGDNESALRLSAAAIEQDPEDWNRHYLYGTCALELKKISAARAAMERARRLAPQESAPQLRLVEILLEAGDDAQALKLMNMLQDTQSQNLEFRLLDIKSALNAGQCDRAFNEARMLLESEILLEEPYGYLARAAVLLHRTAEVEKFLQEGILFYPANSFLNEAVAHLASDNNEFLRALGHFEVALQERPDNMALLLAYAFCLYETGDVELAYQVTTELQKSPRANLVVNQFHLQLKSQLSK